MEQSDGVRVLTHMFGSRPSPWGDYGDKAVLAVDLEKSLERLPTRLSDTNATAQKRRSTFSACTPCP